MSYHYVSHFEDDDFDPNAVACGGNRIYWTYENAQFHWLEELKVIETFHINLFMRNYDLCVKVGDELIEYRYVEYQKLYRDRRELLNVNRSM